MDHPELGKDDPSPLPLPPGCTKGIIGAIIKFKRKNREPNYYFDWGGEREYGKELRGYSDFALTNSLLSLTLVHMTYSYNHFVSFRTS